MAFFKVRVEFKLKCLILFEFKKKKLNLKRDLKLGDKIDICVKLFIHIFSVILSFLTLQGV